MYITISKKKLPGKNHHDIISYHFFGPKPPTHQHSCTCRACRTFLRMLLNRSHLGANHGAGFQAVLKHGDIRDVSTVGNGETKRLTPFLMVAGTLTMGKRRFVFFAKGRGTSNLKSHCSTTKTEIQSKTKKPKGLFWNSISWWFSRPVFSLEKPTRKIFAKKKIAKHGSSRGSRAPQEPHLGPRHVFSSEGIAVWTHQNMFENPWFYRDMVHLIQILTIESFNILNFQC